MLKAMKTVGLNLAYLQPGRLGGTEIYARELIREFQRQFANLEFVLFLNQDSIGNVECSSPRFRKVLVPISSNNAVKRHLLEQVLMPRYAARENVDLLHSMGYVCPLMAKCRQVVTVHDMLYETHPEYLSQSKLRFWRTFVPRSVRRSAATITVSESARADIVKYCKVDPTKVTAIHSGVRILPPLPPDKIETVLQKFEIRRPYVLAVGCGRHKRVHLIEEACCFLRKQRRTGINLVVTGLPENRMVPPRTPSVFYAGFVSSDDLRCLYAGALAYVTASSMEGFGLTILEAMMENTPVISSSAGSLLEVGGDAMIVVDEPTASSIAEAIEKVNRSHALREDLARLGKRRLDRFSWAESARKHLEVYGAALSTDTGSLKLTDPMQP